LAIADCRLPIHGLAIDGFAIGLEIGDSIDDWRLAIGLAIGDWRLDWRLAIGDWIGD
jgi:hypothetical protein